MKRGAHTSTARGRAAARARAALAALTLCATPALARPDAAGGVDPRRSREDAVTFTVSGGISLGVYEAGLTWGVVRLLQGMRSSEGRPVLFHPRLATVTGASAGAVNAFLAAAVWCERPERRGDVDSNLLLDAWLDLDASELLPRSAEGYTPGDGLLAAAPLERAARVLGDEIFGSRARGRFDAGCHVPVGITVTPFQPRIREVAGITASTQRLVVPWRFEVAASGEVRVRRQPLTAGGFADDVLDMAGIPGPGDATPFRPEVAVEALLASTAFPVAFAPRQLCARAPDARGVAESCDLYVDGGIFDNAPLGLGIDLVEGTGGGTVLHPITSFLVEPDRQRLRVAAVETSAPGSPATLASQLQLLGSLVKTARTAELARAARARGWNRTTERLVRESSVAARELGEILTLTTSDAAQEQPDAPGSSAGTRGASRATVGRALSACLEKLTTRPEDVPFDPCAREVLALRIDEATAASEEVLPPDEVVRLAERLARYLRGAARRDTGARQEMTRAEGRLRLQQTGLIAASALLVIADEVQRVSASDLPDRELRRFREAVLEPVRASPAAERALRLYLRDRLDAELAQLTRAAPPSVAEEARRARRALLTLPEGAFFDPELLDGLVAATSEAQARGTSAAPDLAEAWRGIRRVVEARARGVELSARLERLRRDAVDLADGSLPEHRLVVSTRFAPLVGSLLGGFAAFLDRPLRRYDYYAGVYEALHVVAVGICTNEPPASGDAAPTRLRSDPAEIDLTALETQRCIGHVMHVATETLGVRASPGAAHVVAGLAGLELAAWVGSSSRALLLRREPSWAWLDDLAGHPVDDPVASVLAALTTTKVACRAEDGEPLCPAELTFEGFLSALDAHGYRAASDAMAVAMRDPGVWWADTLERLADRALAVERAAPTARGTLSDTTSTVLAAASLAARRAASRGPAPRFVLDPSTIPSPAASGPPGWGWRRVAAHALPYRLSLDFAHGGFGAAWVEPELHLARWLSVQSTLEEIGYRPATGWTTAAGALVVFHAAGVSAGAGPRAWFDWRGGSGIGVEARVAAFQDRLAFGAGMRDPAGGPRGREWFLTLSVADLNGIVFWLSSPRHGG